MNDIDKLDGMIKIKKCGYEFIGGCKELRKYKQALENIKLYINQECKNKQCPQTCANCFIGNILIKVKDVLNDRENAENN